MNIRSLVAATALVASAFAGTAHANLVTNGSLNGTSTVNTEFGSSYGGNTVTGWSANGYALYFTSAATATTQTAIGQYSNGTSGYEMLWGSGSGNSHSSPGTLTSAPNGGGSFVALDGDPSVQSSISQTINGLTPGASYQLSFDWGAGQVQSRNGATTEQFQVSLGSNTQSTAITPNNTDSFAGWQTSVMTFTATSTSELLNFLSVGTPSGLPPIALLDNVSLVQVPEPMSLAMLGGGLVGLGFLRRRPKA